MPYCPKCDMEFVEGVTVCTDCGGPLVESREAAQAQKAAEKEKLEQEMRLRVSRILFHVLLTSWPPAPSPWLYPRKNLRPG